MATGTHSGGRNGFWVTAVISVAFLSWLAGCGGSGGGSAAGSSTTQNVAVTGTVKNVSGSGAARVARSALPDVSGALVDVWADLDGDGVYGADERFGTAANADGFFALSIPAEPPVTRMKIRVSKPGYSEFLREYQDVAGSLVVAPSLSEGEFSEIDVSGVAASPTRAGRVAVDSDQTVVLSLVADPTTGRRTARVARSAGAPPVDSDRNELVRVAFPLKGLELPAGSEKMYANVAYLDTANDLEVMPGGFRAEGEGDTPVDVLSTYAASQIHLYDESGRELMTDPSDRSKTIQIKMAIPPEAYETLEDEDPDTDTVEIPLYYYDEMAATWKLHKNADGAPAHGWLEDNFGNRLTRDDLTELQQVRIDDSGERVPDPRYAPPGVLPADVTVYGVGTVHHFTTWNCDRAGRSSSFHMKFKNKRGKTVDADVRFRKKRGGRTSDHSRPRHGRINLHTDRDKLADNILKRLLDRSIDGKERARLLWTIQHGDNPEAKQALIDALGRYAEDLRDDISDTGSDLERGIRAIFNNKTINDAFIDTDGLDCTKSPDICNGVLGAAAETVNKSGNAKKAAAFLMQIAVDAYNPSNLNYDYVLDKGVGFLDMVTSLDGAGAELKGIPEKVAHAKELVATVKALRNIAKGDWGNKDNFKAYWEAAKQLKTTMEDIKSTASALGSRLKRVAARSQSAAEPDPTPDPADAAEAENLARWLEDTTLYTYEDMGGLILGASRFTRYPFAYYDGDDLCVFLPDDTGTAVEVCTPDESTVAELRDAARAGSAALYAAADRVGARVVSEQTALPQQQEPGGGEVGVLEYFDGTDWIPLPGESDLGVDPEFVPVPSAGSFREGTRDRPMMYLGTWTLDAEPNVTVTGRFLTDTGKPARNVVAWVGGEPFQTDADGKITGGLSAIASDLYVRVEGAYSRYVDVVDGVVDLGEVTLPEVVSWRSDPTSAIALERPDTVSIPNGAVSISGDPVTYHMGLYNNNWGISENALVDDVSNSTGTYLFDSGVFNELGYYYLSVTATTDSGVSSSIRVIPILVKNAPPVLDAVTVTPGAPTVGDEIHLSLTASDPDGADDLAYRGLQVSCSDGIGATLDLWPVQDDSGWVLRTADMRELYRWDVATWTCTAPAWVADRSYSYARKEASFVVTQQQVAPEVTWNRLSDVYSQTHDMSLYPAWSVSFDDRNGDLDRYEVDCGNGQTYESTSPIFDACAYTAPGEYTFSYRATDKGGRSAEVTAAVHYRFPLRAQVTPPADLTVSQQGSGLPTIYELPAAGATGLTLDVSAVSDNGPDGYAEGGGTVDQLFYTLTYQSGTSWYPQYLAYYQDAGGATVPVTVDRPGTYTLILDAHDTQGMYSRSPYTFQVTAPFDGELTIDGKTLREFAASGRPWFLTDEPVVFDVAATGPAGWAPSYAWTSADGTLLSNQKNPTLSFSQPGAYTVRLTLRNGADTVDRQVVREVSFQVYAPLTGVFDSTYQPPVEGEVRAGDAYAVALSNTSGQNLDWVRWSVLTLLPDGSYAAADTPRVTDTGDPLSRTFLFPDAGTYQVRASLMDDRGVLTTLTWDQPIVVTAYPPEISALDATETFGRPPLTSTFTATASDPDAKAGETLAYRWFVDDQEVTGATESTLTHAFSVEGTHTVKVQVTDLGGLSAEATLQVVAAYTPPVIAEIQADPGSGPAPLAVTFTAVASDTDGTVDGYAWDATDDGTWEQDSAAATFTHTYDQPGTYVLRLRVTDNDGKTAEKTRQVYVLDPSAASTVFQFKQLRSDGFGPDYDFTQTGLQGGEGVSQLAHTTVADVNVGPQNVVDLAPVLEFPDLGFYGPYSMAWGQPAITLFQVVEAGTYTVGLTSPAATADARTVVFPATYGCGLLAGYQSWPDTFGTYSTENLADKQVFPESTNVTAGGAVKVLALLGNDTVTENMVNRCVPTYYGYVTGTGTSLTLDATTAVTALPLAPTGASAGQYDFQALTLQVGDGIEFTLGASDLDKDALGRPLIPVVPGATYGLRFDRSVGARSWQVEARVTADALATQSQVTVDFSAVVDRTDLAVSNPDTGDSLALKWESSWGTVSGNIYIDGGSGSLGTVPSLSGTGATVALSYTGGDANAGFYREQAVADLASTVDLGSPGVGVAVGAPNLTVDTTANTITFDFGSVTADVCVVAISGTYDDPALTQYGFRDGSWAFVTDGSVTSYSFSYAIPETTYTYPGGDAVVIPATSALTKVRAEVSCGASDLGYAGLLPNLFQDPSTYGFSGDVLEEKGLVSETLVRKASWALP